MQGLALEKCGVQQLSTKELEETSGGFLQILAAVIAVGAAVGVLNTIYDAGERFGKHVYYLHRK